MIDRHWSQEPAPTTVERVDHKVSAALSDDLTPFSLLIREIRAIRGFSFLVAAGIRGHAYFAKRTQFPISKNAVSPYLLKTQVSSLKPSGEQTKPNSNPNGPNLDK